MARHAASIAVMPQEPTFPPDQSAMAYVHGAVAGLPVIYEKICRLEEENSPEKLAELYAVYSELGGFDLAAQARKYAFEAGFTPDCLNRPLHSFSGGEKTRLSLIRLLTADPDLLLLDEPTNHLDMVSLEWLERFLRISVVPYVVISHDRYFLDRCCTEIWELAEGALLSYSGNYSFYRAQKRIMLNQKVEQAKLAEQLNCSLFCLPK